MVGTYLFKQLYVNTEPYKDGAGLACGVFEYLLNLGNKRPKVLGATHFHEIFENGFLKPRPELAFGHMQVRIDDDAREIENQVTFLYKLVPLMSKRKHFLTIASFRPGRSMSSYGTS